MSDSRFASRKWLLCLLVIILASAGLVGGRINGDQFVSLLTWITGLYMAGNVGRAVADKLTVGSKP